MNPSYCILPDLCLVNTAGTRSMDEPNARTRSMDEPKVEVEDYTDGSDRMPSTSLADDILRERSLEQPSYFSTTLILPEHVKHSSY